MMYSSTLSNANLDGKDGVTALLGTSLVWKRQFIFGLAARNICWQKRLWWWGLLKWRRNIEKSICYSLISRIDPRKWFDNVMKNQNPSLNLVIYGAWKWKYYWERKIRISPSPVSSAALFSSSSSSFLALSPSKFSGTSLSRKKLFGLRIISHKHWISPTHHPQNHHHHHSRGHHA